jgi:D-alanyl-D-alanine-carboxypeptidase/D-alanyl-D-alanine-endopeptidase
MLKFIYFVHIIFALALVGHTEAQTIKPMVDSDVLAVLEKKIAVEKKGVGIVVGMVDQHTQRTLRYGKADLEGNTQLDDDSVFEIGSLTKTFTVLLLADMVVKGEVKLTDPISMYLPKSVTVPSRNGQQIRLIDLATHRSGLPRNVDGYPKKEPISSYVGLTVSELYQFLSTYQLTREIGEDAEYSNVGMGLLGHVLALRAGEDYDSLIKKRITEPLGMTSTAITLSAQMLVHKTQGYDKNFKPLPRFEIPVQEGAGALHSSMSDLLRYVKANLGLSATPLDAAFRLVHQSNEQSYGQKLGWGTWTEFDTEYTNHSGSTFAYKSYIVMDEKNRRGVIVLANSSLTEVGNIGNKLLDSRFKTP